MKINRRRWVHAAACGISVSWLSRTRSAVNHAGKLRVMQGPMVGPSAPHLIRVWVRVSDACRVQIVCATTPQMSRPMLSSVGEPSAATDYTAVVMLTGLAADTTYYYQVLIDGQLDPYLGRRAPFSTKTAPAGPVDFTVAFGSCARIAYDPEQTIWREVELQQPDLFFWLGDNVYGDSLNAQTIAEEYRRQREVLSFRRFGAGVPQLAIWDDHDYGLNDHDRTNPVKDDALQIHKRYWANPSYGLPGTPGIFFEYHYGGVDFYFLDGRYYRDPNAEPDLPGKSLLGPQQLAWLKERLLASQSPFKVLVCGSGWTKAKGPGGDAWSSFVHERNGFFNFLRDRRIEGVVLLSGDTHVAELNCVPYSQRGGYDLYDLTSSPLAQNTTDSWLERSPELRIRPVFFGSTNFGLLQFSASLAPKLTYNVIDATGRPVWRPFELAAADLRNGLETWSVKQDSGLSSQPVDVDPFGPNAVTNRTRNIHVNAK